MDRGKVIKALEHCDTKGCIGCPYYTEDVDTDGCKLNQDSIALIKEQEAEIRQLRLALEGIIFETDEKFMGEL